MVKRKDFLDYLISLLGRPKPPAILFFFASLQTNQQVNRTLKTYWQAHKPELNRKMNFKYLQAAQRL